ncbi:MAG TPA: phage regulatory CII family protein [Rhizomicrobium sp.]|jgi:hypothetical protein|nr:phage regulatory CII family protein [Rhizomicrobium sp.]
MNRAPYKPREPGSLKEAVSLLVMACGGQGEAAKLSRVSRAQIARYTDDSDDNALIHMPVDIVLALEEHCGDMIVTRWLALAQKKIVIDVGDTVPCTMNLSEQIARVAEESGRVMADAARALEHGRFDPKKAPRVRRECIETISALSRLLDGLPK